MTGEDSEDSENYSDAIGTRLTVQTHRQFEEYKNGNELGDAEALRRLVRQALEDEEEDGSFVEALVTGGVLSGFMLLAFGLIETDVWLIMPSGVVLAFAFLANKYRDQLSRYVK